MMILAPPWAVRRKYTGDAPMMILSETSMECDASTVNMVSFGVVAMEVRPVYLAAYIII